jgi:pSer/pThr/pTyr-binding forkhead associated (FHA) protein
MAVLCILDDGSQDIGEVVRIRSPSTVIGRSEGNVIIPHDHGMSARHAEICLRVEEGHYHWYLRDLDSRNGTFIRVAQSVLKDKQELLIGSRRLRFSAGREAAPQMTADLGGLPRNVTREWKVVSTQSPAASAAALVELTADGDGSCLMLNQQEHWLGADKLQCSLLVENDVYVSPRHARLFKDERRRWHIENAGSVNGIWIRINEVQLHTRGDFQLGEQRFRIMFT